MNKNTDKLFDIAVIGGGINGVGIARDAAGRGLSVFLCEKGDLASGTSSTSTKLIHGGLRYLEHFAFGLVRESLKEREILLHAAPFLVKPLTIIMPYQRQLRPKWMIQLGMFLYDHLASRQRLKASKRFKFSSDPTQNPLKSEFKEGFSFSDCATDDARLVVLNALSAQEEGAKIRTYTECTKAIRHATHWELILRNTLTDEETTIQAKVLVNASGPWVNKVLHEKTQTQSPYKIQHIKGSHMVVPKMYQHNEAYLLQHTDKRVIFVIPYQQEFTMIGTTDVIYGGSLEEVQMTTEEINYLCTVVNRYFETPVQPSDVVYTWAGVRPLLKDDSKNASAASRDYKLDLNHSNGAAPLLSVFGGKLTTYRHLGEEAINKLMPFFEHAKPRWTMDAILPGGNIPSGNSRTYYKIIAAQLPFLPTTLLNRYIASYGSRCEELLADCQSLSSLGEHLFHGLYERELHFLVKKEWAKTVEDVLWRRTKLGLLCTEADKEVLAQWLNKHYPSTARN